MNPSPRERQAKGIAPFLAAAGAALLGACGTAGTAPEAPASAGFTVTIKSADGATITLAKRPSHIVSLSPTATEMLFAIGAGPRSSPSTTSGRAGADLGLSHTDTGGDEVRAIARGWRVCVVQFMKCGGWEVGEERSARSPGVEWWTIGDGFSWDSKDMDRTEAVAHDAWRTAREKLQEPAYGLVILDEVTYLMNWGWISTAEVVEAIKARGIDF